MSSSAASSSSSSSSSAASSSSSQQEQQQQQQQEQPQGQYQAGRRKVPLVYHADYDVSLWSCGVPFCAHVSRPHKAQKVFQALQLRHSLSQDDVYEPVEARDDELRAVHSAAYLQSLQDNATLLAEITHVYLLSYASRDSIERYILRPLRLATGGTVLASALAIQYGWAVNLSGGFHTAKTCSAGETLNLFADVPLAIRTLLKDDASKIKRILIVDLDAHFGSGYQTLFALHDEHDNDVDHLVYTDDERIHIFDMYNSCFEDVDRISKQFLTYGIPLHPDMDEEEYILKLENHLPPAIRATSPDIVFYIAGMNVHVDDYQVGGLCLSTKGVVHRDEYVFRICRENDIPIVMVLSSCNVAIYSELIVASLENLHVKSLISLTA